VGVNVAGLDLLVPTSACEWATAIERLLAHQERDAIYSDVSFVREGLAPGMARERPWGDPPGARQTGGTALGFDAGRAGAPPRRARTASGTLGGALRVRSASAIRCARQVRSL